MKLLSFMILGLFSLNLSMALYTFSPQPERTVLLGSIQCKGMNDFLKLRLLYRGNEYTAGVEANGSIKKAHFELYDSEAPQELYILVTEDLEKPQSSTTQHLKTSPEHPYRLFRLTQITQESSDTPTQSLLNPKLSTSTPLELTWKIEELANNKKRIDVPDRTILLLGMNPEYIQSLDPTSWEQASSIVRLPSIVLRSNLTEQMLNELAAKMEAALLDFRPLHPKAHKALMKYANNRVLSLPLAQHAGFIIRA